MSSTTSQAQNTEATECDWTPFGVNPDVIQANASALCSVKYKAGEVVLGATMRVADTQQKPALAWPAGSSQLYTVIMCDPDAPSRESPKFRNYLHWLLVNVASPSDLEQGFEVCPYMGPAPPPSTGLHRYCFLIYAQKGEIAPSELKTIDDAHRKSWSVTNFLASHPAIDGSLPVAGNMFQAQHTDQKGEAEHKK